MLYDKHYFAKFENNQFDKIKQLFDTLIEQVNTKNNDTLLVKNKKFIQLFINELNNFEMPYKREDLINDRTEKLLNNFNKKTDELNEFKPVRPSEIDFSDSIKETPINLLSATSKLTQKRESDLPVLQQILTILKELTTNQQKILDILNKPLTLESIKDNTIIPPNTDSINIDLNE